MSTTPTLSALGWTSGAAVGIGFNSNQEGRVRHHHAELGAHRSSTARSAGTFSLAPALTPLTFTAADLALQQDNGNAVFNFGLTAARQQAQLDTIRAMAGSFYTLLRRTGGYTRLSAGAPAVRR